MTFEDFIQVIYGIWAWALGTLFMIWLTKILIYAVF